MKVNVEFSGGLESLFGGVKQLVIDVPDGGKIKDLLQILKRSYVTERIDLFMQGDTMY